MIAGLQDLVAERARVFGLHPSDLFERDLADRLGKPGEVSANGSCRMLKCWDGWAALNLARPDDLDVVPALTDSEGEPWDALGQAAAWEPAMSFRNRAIELQLAVAVIGEARPAQLQPARVDIIPRKVVDMSALWAGPLCASLLAQSGAQVVRIDSVGRPDPTAIASPGLDARLNGLKAVLPLDLREDNGRACLFEHVSQADVLVTSARPAALARLGLKPEHFPDLTWVAITAHGFSGEAAGRIGFGDDCAAAGGLVEWCDGEPRFVGDALADPLTGLEAALAVLSGRRGLVDMAMSGVAAAYAKMAN
ncbi:hypothetical protein FHS52_002930 [Erythromicrobium ramosum]|uniref:CoA transferase n=1 Tax=Erythrobacter ramosus TaxID=35811 RepID=A0ABR6I264_9SPHN|nr:CoA transferase [Erythrobacter ramosus]MBB3776937.1 hypothetical protein [Erythrobacter ramosus]